MERTIKNVQKYIDEGLSIRHLAKLFKCSPTAMRSWMEHRKLKTKWSEKVERRTWSDNDLKIAVANSKTKAEVIRRLGLTLRPGNYTTLNKYIKKLDLDTSHFTGKAHGTASNPKYKLEEILISNSTYNRSALKHRLLKEGLLENKCEICGNNGDWRDKPLVMILDHINGINNDNRLENLRMLCPNCNSQQETFCRKNKKRVTSRLCTKCKRPIHKSNKSGMCQNCSTDRLGAKNEE